MTFKEYNKNKCIKTWKGRKYVGEMPFISCEKEHEEWINRHNLKR